MLLLFIVTSSMLASYALSPEQFGERCSITLTALLAMVAFKYVISEKLPNISYATLIDFYVLLYFHSAFLIIILQMLSKLGVINESFIQYTVNSVNDTWTAEVDTAFEATTAWAHPIKRNVKISWYLVGLGGAWLAVHVLGVACLIMLILTRWKRNTFFRAPETHVWLGPINLCPNKPP